MADREWNVKAGLGLFWIYGGRLYTLADDGAYDGVARALPPRPARDVLRALMAYTVEQIDAQNVLEADRG